MNEVYVREFKDGDMEHFKSWLYISHVARWYHDPEDWIYEVENRCGEFDWIHHFIVEYDGEPIGFCQYYKYSKSGEDWHGDMKLDGVYSIDYLIGESDYIGRGLGVQTVKALLNKIKEETDAVRIIVQPESDNMASCKTLLSCGFKFDTARGLYSIFI